LDKIELHQVAKKYRKDIIFRNLDFQFLKNKSYVIQGPNGSGKSTLLKLCASYITPTSGEVTYYNGNEKLPLDVVHKYITIAAPYMELPEEFTPLEILDFHLGFKNFRNALGKDEFLEMINLSDAKNKPLNNFSSGMKQRLKLGLAIVSQSDLLLLDEPVINLDSQGVELYKNLIRDYGDDRIIIVCSNNIKEEYDFCDISLNVMDYKKR
jgi:ABC-type multidrug transport system ATPase subunit